MAYMNKEKKAAIAAEIKKIIPKDWKYSLRVHHHSTISMSILSAPTELIHNLYGRDDIEYMDVNQYWAKEHMKECTEKAIILALIDALNLDNHDRSDIMTDYFDVGHYINLSIGRWDKPFQCSTSNIENIAV
jgi:hypothetical protein